MMDEQIPERRLGDEARARRRTELMEAITADHSRTRRWLAPVAAAAVVAGLVGGGYAVTRIGDDGTTDRRDDRSLDVAGSGAVTPSQEPTDALKPPQDPSGVEECNASAIPETSTEQAARPEWQTEPFGPTLRSYRTILARHLDPQGQHIDAKVSNVQYGTGRDCRVVGVGTKLGWSTAGEDGLGVVQVEVGRDQRGSQVWMSFDHWPEVAVRLPAGVEEVEATHEGGRFAVVVTRTDGLVVGILADPLFGNNSRTPISGFDFEIDDLIRVAADPEFALPE